MRLLALLALLFLAACGGAAAPSGSGAGAKPAGWDSLVDAAKKEGTVVIYAQPGTTYRNVIVAAFEKSYPSIKVDSVFVLPAERVSRLSLERQAGRYLADLWIGGTTDAVTTLKEGGMNVPLRPQLALPEVLDESAWFEHKLWWADSAEPYTTLMFVGGVQGVVFVNTKMVDAGVFKSYWDVLDPKWKGKIASTDVRNTGTGAAPARFVYKQPDLGPNWFRRVFAEMDVQISNEQRQLVDWVSQQFKEGASIGPSNGALTMIERAPHPNAAKLYANWLLSREGQVAWQREIGDNSLRIDIPKDMVSPVSVPKQGVSYVNSGTEEFSRAFNPATLRQPIDEGLRMAGKA